MYSTILTGERASLGIDGQKAALRALVTLAVGLLVMAAGFAERASAQGTCPNEALRGAEPHASTLPDCRAYEQVSPVDKGSADALGFVGDVQASTSGDGVTFFSIPPFPGVAGAAGIMTYLSARVAAGWSTQGLFPSTGTESSEYASGLTEDLSFALVDVNPAVDVEANGGGLAPTEGFFELRDNATGSFGDRWPGEAHFADATRDDSHILFEDRYKLTAGATEFERLGTETSTARREKEHHTNLYELDREDDTVSLVGVLPGGEPEEKGAVAGPGGPAQASLPGGATNEYYTQNTISEDGSRVFFTALQTGRIYAREPDAEPARTVAVSPAAALFQAATPDGRYVFFLESEKLYRVDLDSATPAPEPLTTVTSPKVQGMLGVSDDGSYAYFVASEVLARNENPITHEKPKSGEDNLYEWHNDTIAFIARLGAYDGHDWENQINGEGAKWSRVTPDGKTVLFLSERGVTGYPTCGSTQCKEAFLYEAEAAEAGREPFLRCVSCNPRAPEAKYGMELEGRALAPGAGPGSRSSYPPRYLSSDGERVFFETSEALVSGDVNDASDVYEWERSGTGSCGPSSETFSVSSGGCLYLISTGTSGAGATFGDASANGDDVFFFTYQSLVSQDQDSNADLYDARVGGGIPAQNPSLPAPCGGEQACRAATSSTPVFGAPSSLALSGTGNLAPPPPSESMPKAKPPAVGTVIVLGHSVHGTTITLKVAAPGKGTIVAYGVGLQTTTHRAGGAMTYTLKVGLSARARASVKRLRRHKLRYKRKLTVRVRFVPTSGKASQTSVLAMVKA